MEVLEKTGLVSIKPYIAETPTSMGLEDYEMVIFPKTKQSEPLAYTLVAGKRRYINGLDEQAPSVKSIQDKERREAKILQIRKTVAMLEFMHNGNNIEKKIKDDDFWNHVQTFSPTNQEFFGQIRLEYTNEENYLFPADKVTDLVIVTALKAGGFSLCGADRTIAEKNKLRWYLSVEQDEAEINISITRNKNQMLAKLEAIFEEGNHNLYYLCKYLVADAVGFRKSISKNTLYDALSAYLDGKKQIKRVADAVNNFKKATNMSAAELKCYAMAKDLMSNNKVNVSPSGIMNKETGNYLGASLDEFAQHLNNPTNQEETEIFVKILEQDCW